MGTVCTGFNNWGKTKATLKVIVNTTLDIQVPLIGKHKVKSKGQSSGIVTTSGATYTQYQLVTNGHKIQSKISGVPFTASIDFQGAISFSGNSSNKTGYCNTLEWAYTVNSSIISLVGYYEKHTVTVEIFSKYATKVAAETIDAIADFELY